MMVEMNIARMNLMRAQGLALTHARRPHATPAAQEEPVSGGRGGGPFSSFILGQTTEINKREILDQIQWTDGS